MKRPEVPDAEQATVTLAEFEYAPSDVRAWKKKYRELRANSRVRGVECYLSFKQYVQLADKAGVTEPADIGNTLGKFQMSRVGDSGNYVWGNCRFLLKEDNLQEMAVNGGRRANADKRRGRTKGTHAGVAAQAASLKATRAKPFVARDPSGKAYTGSSLPTFCRAKGLYPKLMREVCRGERDQHKGWTGEYV